MISRMSWPSKSLNLTGFAKPPQVKHHHLDFFSSNDNPMLWDVYPQSHSIMLIYFDSPYCKKFFCQKLFFSLQEPQEIAISLQTKKSEFPNKSGRDECNMQSDKATITTCITFFTIETLLRLKQSKGNHISYFFPIIKEK